MDSTSESGGGGRFVVRRVVNPDSEGMGDLVGSIRCGGEENPGVDLESEREEGAGGKEETRSRRSPVLDFGKPTLSGTEANR